MKFIPGSIVPFKLLDSYIDYWPSGTEDENVLNFWDDKNDNDSRIISTRKPHVQKLKQLCIFSHDKQSGVINKRPTGRNGHLSIKDFTLTSCQKGLYLYVKRAYICISTAPS